MAVTTYGRSDALTVERWARRLAVEALKATPIAPLIGKDKNSAIYLKEEVKQGGDKVTCGLRMQLTGQGVTESQTLEGNEESLTTHSDAILINELRHAVRVKAEGSIDAQRVLFNARDEAREGLRDWFAKRISVGFFLHAAGYTGAAFTLDGVSIDPTKAVWNLHNTITAPSSNRIKRAAAAASDQALTSSDTFDLTLVDFAKELAKTSQPKVRPLMIGGQEKYVMYLHPYQVTDLRTNTSTGQWLDIQKAAMMGGQVSKNPIYSGAIGEYNGVILREAIDVPPGVNGSTSASISTVRRAVFLGAQGALVAFGKGYPTVSGQKNAAFKWVEEDFDYEHELGISVKSILGLKKSVYNSEDFGTIVVSTYADAHG